jgi:AraC-like DNA-binding protein
MNELPVISHSVYQFDNRFLQKGKCYGSVCLYQFGDIQSQEDSVVAEHIQPCFEITYAVSGKGMSIVNGNEMPMVKKDICVSLKNDTHSIVSDSQDPLRYFFLAFNLQVSHPLFQKFKAFQQNIKSSPVRIQNDRFNIQDIFVRCLGEFSSPNEFSDVIIEGGLNQIICYIFQNYSLQNYSYHPKYERQELLIYKVISYIEENILEMNTVGDVYNHFNYSPSYLSHIFSRFMHKTIVQYINDCKMEKALVLIESGDHSLTEIADILGFSSIHSFSRAFKTKYSLPPTRFHKRRTGDEKGSKMHENIILIPPPVQIY